MFDAVASAGRSNASSAHPGGSETLTTRCPGSFQGGPNPTLVSAHKWCSVKLRNDPPRPHTFDDLNAVAGRRDREGP